MSAITLTAFTGEQPRVIPRLLPNTAAQSAYDVRLDDGALTPTRKSVQITALGSSAYKTIYRHQGEWLAWDNVVDAVPGPVADDRLYYTGDGAPKIRASGNTYGLTVPRPTAAPVATASGTGAGDIVTRVYVYTWVTSFGEESEPSDASNAMDWQPGQTVTLSGFSAVPGDRAITSQRIYRSQTGQSGTYFYFIAERNASSADFVDNVAVDAFQEALPSADWNAPVDTLVGLTAMPNGMMAAFSGRDLYFCEPFQPHAWPEKYALRTDYDIVGLGAIGTALIIMTTGNPYLATGSSPDTMQMVKLEANWPCINQRGIVDLGTVIAYPSNEGLVAAYADGSINLVSGNLFNRDDWLALSPSTIVAGQMSGRYVMFYDTKDYAGNVVAGALSIDISGTPFIVRTAERATAVFYEIESGALYFLRHGESNVYRLDAPEGPRNMMYWESKEFVLSAPENFGAILVDALFELTGDEQQNIDSEIATIIAANDALIAAGPIGGEMNGAPLNTYLHAGDMLTPLPTATGGSQVAGSGSTGTLNVVVKAGGKQVANVTRTGKAARLVGGFKSRSWSVAVSGDVRIDRIALAKSMDELRSLPA